MSIDSIAAVRPQPSPTGQGCCPHLPACPDASAVDHEAARVVVSYPEQGWSLLCNGVVTFEDTGELMPLGVAIPPHRGPAPHVVRV